jgi:hypothetical protein
MAIAPLPQALASTDKVPNTGNIRQLIDRLAVDDKRKPPLSSRFDAGCSSVHIAYRAEGPLDFNPFPAPIFAT